jgi:regulator of sirC expression with transglutaminase-like and TPR domain
MKPEIENELKALVSLLDDPDEAIFSQVKSKILSFGEEVIPILESAWEYQNDFGELFQTRVENIIHAIQFDHVSTNLKHWLQEGSNNLLDAIILISKFQYPDVDENKIRQQIDQLEKDIWLELNTELTALEKVRVINHILFDVHGFKGNKDDFHDPHNSYINDVLDSKKGNPISLALLYSILAQKHQIPLYGTNLPRHFILAYIDEDTSHLQDLNKEPKVLFYVNPFSNGSVFSKLEIDDFLKQLKIDPKPNYYYPCSNSDIVIRVLNNLLFSYSKQNKQEKTEELTQLIELVTNYKG